MSVVKWDRKADNALDNMILSVWPIEQIITPVQVQGNYPSLKDAVMNGSWPTLAESRVNVR